MPARPGTAPVHPGLAGLNVLVVEDNPINRDLARRYLDKAGIAVAEVRSGLEATELLDRQPGYFQLVLMDVNMPVLDGITATRRIRQNATHDGLPIVAMTANAMAEDRRRCLDAGMQDLAKPFDRDDLYAMIGRWCGRGMQPSRAPPGTTAASVGDNDPLDEYPKALERTERRPEMRGGHGQFSRRPGGRRGGNPRPLLATGHVDAACRAAHTLKGGGHGRRRAFAPRLLHPRNRPGSRRPPGPSWPACVDRLEQCFVALHQARHFPTD